MQNGYGDRLWIHVDGSEASISNAIRTTSVGTSSSSNYTETGTYTDSGVGDERGGVDHISGNRSISAIPGDGELPVTLSLTHISLFSQYESGTNNVHFSITGSVPDVSNSGSNSHSTSIPDDPSCTGGAWEMSAVTDLFESRTFSSSYSVSGTTTGDAGTEPVSIQDYEENSSASFTQNFSEDGEESIGDCSHNWHTTENDTYVETMHDEGHVPADGISIGTLTLTSTTSEIHANSDSIPDHNYSTYPTQTEVEVTEYPDEPDPGTLGDGFSTELGLDALQLAIDGIGLITGFGIPADLISGGISFARGDFVGVGLSLVGVIPFFGEGAGAAKIARGAAKIGKAGAKIGAKMGKATAAGAKFGNKIGDVAKQGYQLGKQGFKYVDGKLGRGLSKVGIGKCFVAGTPVWVYLPDEQIASAHLAVMGDETQLESGYNTQYAWLGVSFVGLVLIGRSLGEQRNHRREQNRRAIKHHMKNAKKNRGTKKSNSQFTVMVEPENVRRPRREKLNNLVLAGLRQHKGNDVGFHQNLRQKIAQGLNTPNDYVPRSRAVPQKSAPSETVWASQKVAETGDSITERSSVQFGDPESGGRHRHNKSKVLCGITLALLGLGFSIWCFVAEEQRHTSPISINGPALTPTSASILNADVETAQVQSPTAIATKSDSNKLTTVNIEDIRCGMRVPAFNPEISVTERDSDVRSIGIDPETWRLIHLRLEKEDGTDLDIELLQPQSWLDEAGATAGSFVEFQVPELTSTSTAEVISVEACPELSSGAGRLVTATYKHESAEIIDITVEGGETIGTTANHPFWCVNTQSFLEADQLEVGQQFESIDGTAVSITSITPRGPPESVFNFEVDFEHVYFVGATGIKVHNSSKYGALQKMAEARGKLRGLMKAGGIRMLRGSRAHHLIPVQLLGIGKFKNLFAAAARKGWNVNSMKNGFRVPSKLHGSHRQYNNYVAGRLKHFLENNKTFTDKQAKEFVDRLMRDLRKAINDNSGKNLNDLF